ncbi:aminoacyl-tRNA hydrolase [Candidatus Kapabacteria bacterium]|nr:aminoacyl-tRNA hydrolase [Candidatus Kapabacteria bacterium]
MKYDYAFVGLGNPGDKYAETRHNIGWMLIEKIASKYKLTFKAGSANFYYSEMKYAGKNVILILPTTYMNSSGEAVAFVSKKYKIEPKNILIFVDEYNFPLGKIHIKSNGSGGGHNGTTSVINHIGSEFVRLRLGIDRNFGQGELVEYVLAKFKEDEVEQVTQMLNDSVLSLEHFLKVGYKRAISDINSGTLIQK